MICQKCNSQTDTDSLYCTNCGAKVTQREQPVFDALSSTDNPANESVKPICIVADPKSDNSQMGDLLGKALDSGGVFTVERATKAEYETENVKYELLGTDGGKLFVFIGKTNDALFEQIEWKFDSFGMKYGWKGNKALLSVEFKKWKSDEVKELTALFGEDSKKSKNFFQKGLDTVGAKFDKLPLGLKIATGAAGTVLFGLGGLAIAGTTFLVNGAVNNEKVFESQKIFLVKKFLTEGLDDFVGGK